METANIDVACFFFCKECSRCFLVGFMSFWKGSSFFGVRASFSRHPLILSTRHRLRLYTYTVSVVRQVGLWRPKGCCGPASNSNKLNSLRIPTGRGQTSCLCTSTAKELNQGRPRTNPASGQSGISRLQIRRPLGHAYSC